MPLFYKLDIVRTTCTCGESNPETVVYFQGNIEHHLFFPNPCWVDVLLFQETSQEGSRSPANDIQVGGGLRTPI